jgi:hypothetical protein
VKVARLKTEKDATIGEWVMKILWNTFKRNYVRECKYISKTADDPLKKLECLQKLFTTLPRSIALVISIILIFALPMKAMKT